MRQRRQPCDTRVRVVAFVLVVLCLLLPARARGASTDELYITLAAEVQDLTGWLAFHQDVVSSSTEWGKPLRLSLPGDTSGARWLRIDSPKFFVKIATTHGSRSVRLDISGILLGAEGQSSVIAFERAALLVQTGAVANELTIVYGLTGIVARLLELQITRP